MSYIESDHARFQCDCVSQIEYLEEIMINILARLPVENVVACKCVAKHLLRLISEPQFPVTQLSLSQKNPKYIICPYPLYNDTISHLFLMEENGNISRRIHLPAFSNICSPEIVCSLNGLICSVDTYEDGNDLIDVHIHIFNPITQDFLLLPSGSPSHVTLSVGLAFDPKTNDFKAFRFFSNSAEVDNVKYRCEVYTFSSAEWRMISEGIECAEERSFYSNPQEYVCVAGKMYWSVRSKDNPKKVIRILPVDMSNNFTEIDLPTKMYTWSFLIALEGCLSVVHSEAQLLQHEDSKDYIEVYKLESEGWCLRARAEFDLGDIYSFNSVAARGNGIFFIIRLYDWSLCYLILDLNEDTWLKLDLGDTFEEYNPIAFPHMNITRGFSRIVRVSKRSLEFSTLDFGLQM